MDESLRQATLGATNITTPGSPLGNFPELSKLYESSFQLPQSSGAAGVLASQAGDIASAARAKKSASNYQKVKRPDGGFGFYDGDGNEISAADYAAAIGKKASEVLGDSENPIDIGYLEDYKNLQDYIGAKVNAKYDKKAAEQAKETERKIKEATGEDISGMFGNDLIERFKAAYPTVYGGNKAGVPMGQTLIPKAGKADEDPRSKFESFFKQYGNNIK